MVSPRFRLEAAMIRKKQTRTQTRKVQQFGLDGTRGFPIETLTPSICWWCPSKTKKDRGVDAGRCGLACHFRNGGMSRPGELAGVRLSAVPAWQETACLLSNCVNAPPCLWITQELCVPALHVCVYLGAALAYKACALTLTCPATAFPIKRG